MQEKLKNPLFYGENRTAAHSDHKYYVSEAEFAQNIQSLKKTLDGVWKFRYAKNLAEAPEGFYKMDADCLNWEDICVPAHIQLEGYDRSTIYSFCAGLASVFSLNIRIKSGMCSSPNFPSYFSQKSRTASISLSFLALYRFCRSCAYARSILPPLQRRNLIF